MTFPLTGVVRDLAVFSVQSVQKRRENGRQAIPPNFVTTPPTLSPLPEVDPEDGIPLLMRDGLEHVRFWTEWTSPIPLNERLEVRIWVICANEGRRSVCRRFVTFAEVGD